jgi:LppP/LprE lipoprotein
VFATAVAMPLIAALSACGSGDSTVALTPEPTTTRTVAASPAAAPPPSVRPGPPAASPGQPPTSSATPAADPCAVDLAAPEIARAAAALPPDPRSKQRWSPEPIAGNYNECAQLSAVIIKANTNEEHPNTRAIMFHLGKFIPTGEPDTFGFNGMDLSASTGNTVALKYTNGIPGLDSVVKFRWNGNGVELIGNVGQ